MASAGDISYDQDVKDRSLEGLASGELNTSPVGL